MDSVNLWVSVFVLCLSGIADMTEGTGRRGMQPLLFPEVENWDLASEMSVVGGNEPSNLYPRNMPEEGEETGQGFRRLGGEAPMDINDFFGITSSRHPLFYSNNNLSRFFGSGGDEITVPMIHIPRLPIDEGDSGGRLENIPTTSTKPFTDTTGTSSQKETAREPGSTSNINKSSSFSTPKSTTVSPYSRQSSSGIHEARHVTNQPRTNVSAVMLASNTTSDGSSGPVLTTKQIIIISTVIPIVILFILVGILVWIIFVRKKGRRNVRVGVEMQSPPQPTVNAPPEGDTEAVGSSSSISKVSNNSNNSVLHAIRENGHSAENGNRREAWNSNGGVIDAT